MALFDAPDIPTDTSGLFIAGRWPTTAILTFVRPTRTQNSAGELVLSMVSAATLVVDLQPVGGGQRGAQLLRMVQGQVDPIAYTAVIRGNPDLQVGDRCTLSGADLEVKNIDRWGTVHAEADLAWIGR